MSELNQVIRDIQESTSLSAEARNALHGCTEGHPWCKGKSLDDRKLHAIFAASGVANNRYIDKIKQAKS